MKVDFHVHSWASFDSVVSPEHLTRKSKVLGIIPAITDHNTMDGFKYFKGEIDFIPGIEIKTDKGDLIALYLQDLIPKNTSLEETLDRIREQDAVSYLPHMYDITRAGAGEVSDVDIIETFNARCPDYFNKKADEFASKHNLIKGAGSDCHFISEFGSTFVEMPDFDIENPKEMLNSLKKGRIYGNRSPVYLRGPIASLYKKIKRNI
ncbi:PHP domain-containing protein [Candidatus Micrarchaeota archaeon]|nr:PHP domain-containing protein [Candidatus Micrarchaeota archaeon]